MPKAGTTDHNHITPLSVTDQDEIGMVLKQFKMNMLILLSHEIYRVRRIGTILLMV